MLKVNMSVLADSGVWTTVVY